MNIRSFKLLRLSSPDALAAFPDVIGEHSDCRCRCWCPPGVIGLGLLNLSGGFLAEIHWSL